MGHIRDMQRRLSVGALAIMLTLLVTACSILPPAGPVSEPTAPAARSMAGYIVQAGTVEAAKEAVADVGGLVTHELDIIRAVGATLSAVQVERLRSRNDVRRGFEDATIGRASCRERG